MHLCLGSTGWGFLLVQDCIEALLPWTSNVKRKAAIDTDIILESPLETSQR